MLKKGLALNYVFLTFLAIVVILVSVLMITNFSDNSKDNYVDYNTDFEYVCIALNDTEISYSDFKDVFYGFLTNQCSEFNATIKTDITKEDIENILINTDENRQVILVNECTLPFVNSGNVFITTDSFSKNSNIYLTRKNIINSDILICD